MKKRGIAVLIGLLLCFTCFAAACGEKAQLLTVSVKQGTLKTEYALGEALDVAGAKLIKTMSDNSKSEADITAEMVTGFDASSSGKKTMLITYEGRMCAAEYTVAAKTEAAVLTASVKAGTLKKTYISGSQLDLSDAKLTVSLSDGTTEEVSITADMVAGFDGQTLGSGKTLYITYRGKLCLFFYNVIEEKEELDAPVLTINGNVLTWAAQSRATAYEIYRDGKLIQTVTDNAYTIEVSEYGSYVFTVKAKGEGEIVTDSKLSDEAVYTYAEDLITQIKVDKDGFTWNECKEAVGYAVEFAGKEQTVPTNRMNVKMEDYQAETMSVRIKPIYGNHEGVYCETFVFHVLKTPESLAVAENATTGVYTFTWEKGEAVSAGYKLYAVADGEELQITTVGAGVTQASVSFGAFKDKQIDGVYVQASANRADYVAVGESNSVELPHQITARKPVKNLKVRGNFAEWEQDDSVSGYYKLTGVGSSVANSIYYDTNELAGGSYTITVKAASDSPYILDSPAVSLTFKKLLKPAEVKLENGILLWTNAGLNLKYQVEFGSESFLASAVQSHDLSDIVKDLQTGEYRVAVRTVPNAFEQNTIASEAVLVFFAVQDVAFSVSGSTLSWAAIDGATGYNVRVNDGEWQSNGMSRSLALTDEIQTVDVQAVGGSTVVRNNRAEIAVLKFSTYSPSPSAPSRFYLKGSKLGALPALAYWGMESDWLYTADTSDRREVLPTDEITENTTVYVFYDHILYEYTDTEAMVKTYVANTSWSDPVVIPGAKRGKPVTAVKYEAFKEVPAVEITLPGSVKTVGARAFANSAALKTVHLSEGLTSIGESAFEGCTALQGIKLPNSVKTVGASAFKSCKAIASIDLGTGLTEISQSMFWGCNGKPARVTVPEGVTKIGRSAFGSCQYFYFAPLPASLKEIDDSAFQGAGLSGIVFNEGLERIGDQAFSNTNLSQISLPVSAVNVSGRAFDSTMWYANQPNGLFYLGKFVMGYKGAMPNYFTAEIAQGTEIVADFAFYPYQQLSRVILPEGLKRIGVDAFRGCSGLSAVTIPASVEYVGNSAFAKSGVSNIYLSSSTSTESWHPDWKKECNANIIIQK